MASYLVQVRMTFFLAPDQLAWIAWQQRVLPRPAPTREAQNKRDLWRGSFDENDMYCCLSYLIKPSKPKEARLREDDA